MDDITIEDICKGVKEYKEYCKKHRYSPDFLIYQHPGEPIIPRTMFFDLKDGTEVKTTVNDYNEFVAEYGYYPDECKNLKEFKDKLMVAKL
jgi:hypothetical protein